ncbi:MAG: glucosaminidase domain-containing protein [Gammaproteobacteria bacterium]|nr:glucosaminidase domain-containing protein [Gammaproteobacteria bacterium]
MILNRVKIIVQKKRSAIALVFGITGLILLVWPSEEPLSKEVISEIKPITVLPDFGSNPSVQERKLFFFDYLEDYVVAANAELEAERKEIVKIMSLVSQSGQVSDADFLILGGFYDRYGVKTDNLLSQHSFDKLLLKVDQVPVSLTLAQAANESAWGTSRFAITGKNIFGQWCYREGCGMVPNKRKGGARHEVRSFDTIAESVEAYFFNLNTSSFYEGFRFARGEMRATGRELDSFELAFYLNSYSERGESYIDEIQTLIEQNFLTHRD